MLFRIAWVLVIGAMTTGCSENAAPEQAKPEPVAVVEATPTTIDEEMAKRIGVLNIRSGLHAEMSIQQARLAALRAVMKDGSRYEYTNLLEDTGKARSEVLDEYTAIIQAVVIEDLKLALKEGMAAEIYFYDQVSDVTRIGDATWFSDIQKASEAIRQAHSKIEVEKTLAKAK